MFKLDGKLFEINAKTDSKITSTNYLSCRCVTQWLQNISKRINSITVQHFIIHRIHYPPILKDIQPEASMKCCRNISYTTNSLI